MNERFLEVSEAAILARTERSIDVIRSQAFSEPGAFVPMDCESCGEPLVEFRARRKLPNCTVCQERIDKNAKQFRVIH